MSTIVEDRVVAEILRCFAFTRAQPDRGGFGHVDGSQRYACALGVVLLAYRRMPTLDETMTEAAAAVLGIPRAMAYGITRGFDETDYGPIDERDDARLQQWLQGVSIGAAVAAAMFEVR